ncbi:hypothetical protein [Sulfitobacter pacificus]|uniref:hypothetical protein n=1 Tax=Sulfitobacter pacificus TaxID=1499314 RepID=UPI0031079793
MVKKPYKGHKKGAGRHVQLPEWLQASEAWRTLPVGPRALYVELKRRFNGSNNGRVILSHRDAAKAVNAHRNTVGRWFTELEDRGFIVMAQAPHLGPSGIGKSSHWTLTEYPTDNMKPATVDFMRWPAKQKPPTTKMAPRHNEGASTGNFRVVGG